MNNFTKTESLPKTGHVNEVCKEWLVREDSALAYKLQSQEINDFYKGNRFRNAVVREDFPTALNEQIKEKENADRQSEVYRRRLMEQEEKDKWIAKEISDKIQKDLKEQQQKELLESELIAQQMQQIYVNLPPIPPPAARNGNRPPPRPAKASIHQNQNTAYSSEQPSTSNGLHHNHQHHQAQSSRHPHKSLQQHSPEPIKATVDDGSYVTVSLAQGVVNVDNAMEISNKSQQSRKLNQSLNLLVSDGPSPSLANNRKSHHQNNEMPSMSAARHRNVFDAVTDHNSPINPNVRTPGFFPNTYSYRNSLDNIDDYLVEYSDVADSIRHYDINTGHDTSISNTSTHNTSITDSTDSSSAPFRCSSIALSPSNENLLKNENKKFQKLSPEKYDELVGNAVALPGLSSATALERHMQAHADDIELYVEPCDYASLKEIGLPMHEIKEMSKKLKQEQKDEMLARRLQEMESKDGLSQEARDRMLAIEAQDKELAKMLQERERAKVKRAKEKARLKKSQHKEQSSSICPTSLHCGQLLPQDCLASPTSPKHNMSSNSPSATMNSIHNRPLSEDLLDVEAYSNPIDVLQNNQQVRTPNGTLTNGSLTRDQKRHSQQFPHLQLQQRGGENCDDDIYTLPVDSCGMATNHRPSSLSIGIDEHSVHNNSMSRSENYSIDSHESMNGLNESLTRGNYSKNGSFDKSSSPTPPYMPIQGTRRSNSSEDRKKKSKDKCTHQ